MSLIAKLTRALTLAALCMATCPVRNGREHRMAAWGGPSTSFEKASRHTWWTRLQEGGLPRTQRPSARSKLASFRPMHSLLVFRSVES
jgi:hypothetical protein